MLKTLATVLGCLLVAPGYAQILIGQVAGFTGTVADGVKDTTYGAKLYFEAVNAAGGVNGQKIELISVDDKFDAQITLEQARSLIEDKHVSALFLTRGTPQSEILLPLLEKHGIALVAPSSGSMSLRQPVLKYVFNVRGTYQYEAEKIVTHFTSNGLTRIAVVYAEDSFGLDSLTGAKAGFAKAKVEPVALEKLTKANPDFAGVAQRLVDSKAQLVVMIASGKVALEAIKNIRATKQNMMFAALSNNATAGFASGSVAGTVVSQVFPLGMGAPMVKELTTLAKAKDSNVVINSAMLEGFCGAKVLVQGLRRAGPSPSREKIRLALEAINRYDLGGASISYDKTDHSGFDFAELTVVADGRFKR